MNTILSKYEIILSLDDSHSLLVNGLYGAIDVIDRSEAVALSRGEFERISGEETERLISRGHLTDSLESETEDLTFLAGVYRKVMWGRKITLYLLPTYDCNFRCPYCFEKHRLSRGENWLKKTMSKEMVDKIFTAVEKEKKLGITASQCVLFGGEPFLPENMEIIEYIAKKATAAGMTLSVVTNGYCVDHFSDILSEYPFEFFLITLDGPGEYNDRSRVYTGDGGSYEKILENIALALSKGIRVHVRINTSVENIDNVHELKQVFTKKGFTRHEDFSYSFMRIHEQNSLDEFQEVSSRDIAEKLMQKGFEKKEAMELVASYGAVMKIIEGLLDKRDYLIPSDIYCGAENMMYVVDREGAVYPCSEFVAIDEMRIGSINMEKEKFAFTFDLLKWNLRQVTRMPECIKCPYVFFCGGGCAYKAYKKTGDPANPHCGETREIYCDVISMLCGERFRKTGEREMTKSLKEAVSKYTPEERSALMTSEDTELVMQMLKKNDIILENISNIKEE